MTIRKRKENRSLHGNGSWIVTFADLVAVLMAFFVMMLSFSDPDQKKATEAAGSIKDALGVPVIADSRVVGVIEKEGLPVRQHPADVAIAQQDTPTAEQEAGNERESDKRGAERAKAFHIAATATALQQALSTFQDAEGYTDQVSVTTSDEGVKIQLVDQEKRTMFGEGASEPTPAFRRVLEHIAPLIAQIPVRILVTGHASSAETTNQNLKTGWQISTERAISTATILQENGVRAEQLDAVRGKSDMEPLFTDNPAIAANRRVEIDLMNEASPLP